MCTKNKKRIQKFKETEDSQYIDQNELDKAGFQHDMTHGDFGDLSRRIAYGKVSSHKALNIAENTKYDCFDGL